jgi:hypothetical protein
MRSTDQAGALLVLFIAGLSVFRAIAKADEPALAVRRDEGFTIRTLQAQRASRASGSILPGQEWNKLREKNDRLRVSMWNVLNSTHVANKV